MKITEQPIVPHPTAQAKKDWDKRVQSGCIQDGRASRRAGIPISRCPAYRDNDMVIDWRNGWRWEDEELRGSKS